MIHLRQSRPQWSLARHRLLLLCALLTVSNFVLYGLYVLRALLEPVFSFYYDPLEGYAGFLYDFFLPVHYAYHLDVLAHQWSNSPPFLHLFCYVVSLLLRTVTPLQGGQELAHSMVGQITFGMLALGMLLCVACGKALFASMGAAVVICHGALQLSFFVRIGLRKPVADGGGADGAVLADVSTQVLSNGGSSAGCGGGL